MTVEKTGLAREFQPVEDAAEALRLLREGAKTLAATMIWTKNQELVIQSHLTLLSDVDRALLIRAPEGFDIRAWELELSRKQTKEVFFSVSLLSANIFFKTAYRGVELPELAFDLPAQVYKVQRRSDLRFPIPHGYTLRIEFSDVAEPPQTQARKAYDISAGGLSFLVTEEEAIGFSNGMILHSLTFTINQRKIVVDAEVRHSCEIHETKRRQHVNRKENWRVGVQFIGLRAGDGQAIAAYVFEESRKFFTRFA